MADKHQAPNRMGKWIITGILLSLPALAFSWWSSQEDYPEAFPTQAEELDRAIYLQGGQNLFPDRYQEFHRRLLETRAMWRRTTTQWWATKDGPAFQETYQALLDEGTMILEATRQKSLALRMEVESFIRPEKAQVERLRSLTHLFEMGSESQALAHAEGLLMEATNRLDSGKFGKARTTAEKAVLSLQTVEAHVMGQMRRYTDEQQLAIWNQWVNQTIRWSNTTGGIAVVVFKASRRLQVYRHGHVIADYPVDLGFSGLLDKQFEGDGATPEGRFRLIRKKSGGDTQYYRALLLDYPSPEHKRRFQELQAKGEIPAGKMIGGAIEIHGKAIDSEDQTSGCVALENEAIEQIFTVISVGNPITIVGAIDTNNDVVARLQALEDHIQHRQIEQKKRTSLMGTVYATS